MTVISHEIRNTLQVIKGLVQLLDLRLSGENRLVVGKYVQSLNHQVNHLTALADDILTAYRLGTGKMAIQVGDMCLVDSLYEAVTPYLRADGSHSLITDFSIPDDLRVRADPQRAMQIVANLLSNAAKYTPVGKRIWVRAHSEADFVKVIVEDEGIGIPSDQLEKVFDGFVRAHNVTEWKSGGIGLGLYISRNLARRMGGDLWAESRPEGGTTMTLRLPLHSQLTLA